jgi:hypothetical protein
VPSTSLHGRQFLLDPPAGPGLLLVMRLGPDLSEEQAEALDHWIAEGDIWW